MEKKRTQSVKPLSWSLLETIKIMMKEANMIRKVIVDNALGLFHIHSVMKLVVEKGIRDI